MRLAVAAKWREIMTQVHQHAKGLESSQAGTTSDSFTVYVIHAQYSNTNGRVHRSPSHESASDTNRCVDDLAAH